jgi:hypothetical protein
MPRKSASICQAHRNTLYNASVEMPGMHLLQHPSLDHGGFIGITRARLTFRASRIAGRNA